MDGRRLLFGGVCCSGPAPLCQQQGSWRGCLHFARQPAAAHIAPALPPQAPQIIFHGPSELVLPFFDGLGFQCPERKGIAEFLQEVPTLAGEWMGGWVAPWPTVLSARIPFARSFYSVQRGVPAACPRAPTRPALLPPRLPSRADQQRFWAGNPAEWKFVSAQEIADDFYQTTDAGRDMMRDLEVGAVCCCSWERWVGAAAARRCWERHRSGPAAPLPCLAVPKRRLASAGLQRLARRGKIASQMPSTPSPIRARPPRLPGAV